MVKFMDKKKGIVLYSSTTGYTKRYAEHLAKELDYDIKPLQKANLFSVSCYPTVIFGGGLHHNRIDGIQAISDGANYFGEQTLIFFSVGLASVNDELIKQIKAKNFPKFTPGTYFYQALPGGLAYKDTQPGGAMAQKIEFYRQKRSENKKLTRGDKIALAIADGESLEQNRFDASACAPIIAATRKR